MAVPWHGLVLVAVCSASLSGAAALAQPQPATATAGLNALDEQRVTTELADLGLSNLLKRQFALQGVPAAQQQGMLALMSVRKLSDPSANLSFTERQRLLDSVSSGIDAALPAIHDPTVLMQIAQQLMTTSIEPDINALEYFGDNPATAARVRPAVQTVLKIYDQAQQQAAALEDQIANHLTPNDDAGAKRWQQMDELHTLAMFNRLMANYDLCLTLPRSDPERAALAQKAIDGLKQYDNNDSAVQAAVRVRTGKLQLVRGDYDTAASVLQSVYDDPQGQIKPAPTAAEQYEARYFSAVAALMAGKLDDAQQQADALDTWQHAHLSDAQQKGASAAMAMLRYRLLIARADAATDPAEKQHDNDAATAVLLQLLRDQPQYRTVIFQQLASRLPTTQASGGGDLASMDPLLLLALQQQGEQQYNLPENEPIDTAVMDRAIAAAREVMQRGSAGTIDAGTAMRSAYILGYLLQREGKPKQAAAAFLDFAQQYPQQKRDADDALDHATALIGELRKQDAGDEQVRQLYDRFLPLAINPPFNRKQFAFEYAVQLQREGHYQQAADYFRGVPTDDPRYAASRFYLMVAIKQQLDDPANANIPAAERAGLMVQLQQLADQINTQISSDLAASGNDTARQQRDRSRLARTALIAAGLAAGEQHDPNRALALLDGFEAKTAGLPDAADLLFEALSLRVNAYMALGQNQKATDTLVQLLKTKQGDQGPALVFDLLKKIDADLTAAKAAGDTAQMQQLAQNRATLSGFLVSWAENNPDPKVRALVPRYQTFDAATKQQAAELTNDPATRTADLSAALKQYQALAAGGNNNPAVQLGMALVQYDLGNYQAAKETLGPLITNQQVGGPTTTVEKNGEPTSVENPQYWEANLRLLQSIAAVAKQKPDDAQAQADLADAKRYLKQLYVEWPKTIGGSRYHDDFEKLRQQLTPDFNPQQAMPVQQG